MIKRLLVGVLSLSLLLCSTVTCTANDITNAVEGTLIPSGTTLDVNGELGAEVAGYLVNLIVTKKGLENDVADGEYIVLDQTTTNASGEYAFEVDLENLLPVSGTYNVKTIAEVETAVNASFTYYKLSDQTEAKTAVADACNGDSEMTLAEALEANKVLLAFADASLMAAIDAGNADELAAYVETKLGDADLDAEDVTELLHEAAIVNNIQHATSADAVKEAIALSMDDGADILGLAGNETYLEFTAEEDDKYDYDVLAGALAASVTEYTTLAELEKDFVAAGAVAELLNDEGVDAAAEIIEKYADSLDLTKFNAENNNQEAVIKAVIRAVEKKTLTNIDALQDILDVKISKDDDDDDDDKGGSSGGGGYFVSRVENPLIVSPGFNENDIVPSEVTNFEDMADYDWAAESVERLKKEGIINGYSSTRFAPEMPLTRAELSKMICGIFGYEQSNNNVGFADVSANDWFSGYVWTMYEKEIVKGTDGNLFAPNANITRQDAFTIIYRIIGSKYADTTMTAEFTDSADVSDYAVEAATAMVQSGLVKGSDGKINPKDSMTRAETAVLLSRLLDLVNQK